MAMVRQPHQRWHGNHGGDGVTTTTGDGATTVTGNGATTVTGNGMTTVVTAASM
jgi:hypothetical protein